MTPLAASRETAAQALGLRAWALRRVLGGDVATPAPAASAAAWHVFLRWERCAALLGTPDLPGHAAAVLRDAVFRETRHILSARAQLRTIARIAQDAGIDVIALKGSADVARGMNVPSADVDVLARPGAAEALVAALDGAGFTAESRGNAHHLEPRTLPGALHVEVHFGVSGFDAPGDVPWDRAEPVEAMPPLLVLAGQDHAWTVLCQAARTDVSKRHCIRDLAMLRAALARCDAPSLATLHDRIDGSPYAVVMRQMLERATGGGGADPAGDRLARVYLMHTRTVSLPRPVAIAQLWQLAADGIAIGPLSNWRRLESARAAATRYGWRPRRLLTLPAFLVSAAAAATLTADAPWLPPSR